MTPRRPVTSRSSPACVVGDRLRSPATDEEATTQARQRLSQMLAGLAALDVPAEGDLGKFQPAWGHGEGVHRSPVRRDHSGHPAPARLALAQADLPHRAERRFGLPVTTIITKR